MQQLNPTIAGNRFSIKLFILAFVFTGAALAWLSWSTYGLYGSQHRSAVFSAGAAVFALLLFSWLAIIRRMSKSHALLLSSIARRKQAEEVLRRVRDEMEAKVRERTGELAQANEALESDIAKRKRAEMERQVIAEVVQSAITTVNLDELFKLA